PRRRALAAFLCARSLRGHRLEHASHLAEELHVDRHGFRGGRSRRNSAIFVSPIRFELNRGFQLIPRRAKPMNTLPLLKRLVDVESPKGIVPSSFAPSVPGLDELLAWKNGFYAYRHGLHVFGRCTKPRWHSLETWNDPAGWVREYGEFAE